MRMHLEEGQQGGDGGSHVGAVANPEDAVELVVEGHRPSLSDDSDGAHPELTAIASGQRRSFGPYAISAARTRMLR